MFAHGSAHPSSQGRKPLASASRPMVTVPPYTGVPVSATTVVSTSPSASVGVVPPAASPAASSPSPTVDPGPGSSPVSDATAVSPEELSSLPHDAATKANTNGTDR